MKKLTIIGSGPGGHMAAFAAARAGHSVTLVESAAVGGTCLHTGCIPTKTFKSSADALEKIRHMGNYAITGNADAAISMPDLLARKKNVIGLLTTGLEKTCASLKITLVRGRGRVISAREVAVSTQEGTVLVEGDNVIIATGSRPLNLPSLPADHRHILNSDDALALDRVPASIAIVGGGVIGCEMACIFRSFGAQVTVIEGQDRLLPIPSVDGEMSKLLLREMKKAGIRVELGKTVSSAAVEQGLAKLAVSPSHPKGDAPVEPTMLDVESVFVTVGRVPNTEGLGLDEAGIAVTPRGWIEVDDCLQTSVPGVFAIGDVLGPEKIMLAHMASAEAEHVVAHLDAPAPCDYSVVPSAIFTTPEIGCVGLSEEQALTAGLPVRCTLLQVRELGKAHAMGEIAGVFKLVAHAENNTILGAHLCGPHATDLIAEAGLAIRMGAKVDDVAHTIHAHPTLAEGFYELCHKAARP